MGLFRFTDWDLDAQSNGNVYIKDLGRVQSLK